jgi:hypothetical protein
MVFVLQSSPNHTPIKYRCPINKSTRITPASRKKCFIQQPNIYKYMSVSVLQSKHHLTIFSSTRKQTATHTVQFPHTCAHQTNKKTLPSPSSLALHYNFVASRLMARSHQEKLGLCVATHNHLLRLCEVLSQLTILSIMTNWLT